MYSVPSVFAYDPGSFSEKNGHLVKAGILNMNVQDPTKAVDSFEMEFLAYYACAKMLRYRLGQFYEDVYPLLLDQGTHGSEFSNDIRDVFDEVYEDVLAVVEFSLNHLTSYSDESQEQFMAGVRFSLSRYLRMDRSRADRHQLGKKHNTVLFTEEDIRSVPFITFRSGWANKLSYPATCSEVLEQYFSSEYADEDVLSFPAIIRATVDRRREQGSVYVRVDEGIMYDGLLAEFWTDEQARAPCRYVHLMDLLDKIMETCSSEHYFCIQAEEDYADMCADVLVPNTAFLSQIGKRDTNFNFGMKTTSQVSREYGDRGGVRLLEDFTLFARALDCVMTATIIEKIGRNYRMDLFFTVNSLIRMFDSDVFGRDVYLSDMLFVTADDVPVQLYCDNLRRMGFVPFGPGESGYGKVSDVLEDLEVKWTPSGRVKNFKLKGCFGYMRSISRMSPVDFIRTNFNGLSPNTIIVCDPSIKQDIIRVIRLFSRGKGGKDRVWRIAVLLDQNLVGRRGYSALDTNGCYIMEIGVTSVNQLFDLHSNGILIKTRTAIHYTLRMIAESLGVSDTDILAMDRKLRGTDLKTVMIVAFIDYSRAMLKEIGRMAGTRIEFMM